MNWSRWMGCFQNWNFKFIGEKNQYQGNGSTNHPRNHNCKKASKAKMKNRAGKKARKRNRK